jgi:hypothetical protein
MVSGLYINTKKSYYTMLKNKLLQGNSMFTVYLTNKGSCYSGKSAHRTVNTNFNKWANTEASTLDVSNGNIINIDESIFEGFPQIRPMDCAGSYDNWTHPEYWSKKQSDYGLIKKYIDNLLLPLKKEYDEEIRIEEQMAIDEEIRLLDVERKAHIAEENRLADLELQKQLTVQEREDDRIIKILQSLGITQQAYADSSPVEVSTTQPNNMNIALLVGGIGLVLLVGLKK